VEGDACALEDFSEGWETFVCRLPDDVKDPQGVVRGGSFASDGGALRATYRRYIAPDARIDTNGFRCALSGPDF